MAAAAPPPFLTRRERLALWLAVTVMVACGLSYVPLGSLVKERVVLPAFYLVNVTKVCGPSLGARTWRFQGLWHESAFCEDGCRTRLQALCDATREGRRISHDVLTR